MKKILTLLIINLILIQNLFAEVCDQDISNFLPSIKIPKTNLEASINYNFCFDPDSNKDFDLNMQFVKLKRKNVFDEDNCVIDNKMDKETSNELSKFVAANIKNSMKIFTDDVEKVDENSLLVFTNSENKEFIEKSISKFSKKINDIKQSVVDFYEKNIKSKKIYDSSEYFNKKLNPNKLELKDNVEIAAMAVSGSLIGIIVERDSKAFKNNDGSLQHDKILHSNTGALINIGSVAGAYLAIETSGLGDKLNLSKKQKKWTILLTGTIMGLLVGYGKERFYDYYRQDIHTYDPKLKGDMGATWLGGGALNIIGKPIAIEF